MFAGAQYGVMPEQEVPLASAWCTKGWAAERIGVSLAHIGRLCVTEKLHRYAPRTAKSENSKSHRTMLNVAEVEAYAAARRLLKGITE